MPKVVMTQKAIDPLMKNLGKAKTVERYDADKARIVNNDLSKLKVTFLETTLKEEGLIYSEVTKLKLEPFNSSANLRQVVNSSITVNTDFTNYFVGLHKTDKATELQAKNLNQSVASYDIVTNFNYLSIDYDILQRTVSEAELPSIISNKTKEDFVDYRQQRRAAPINFSSTSQRFKNFVVPNAGPAKRDNLNAEAVTSMFPYYNEIKITNKVTNKFTNFITEVGIFDAILNAYKISPRTREEFNTQIGEDVITQDLPVFDLLSWVNSGVFTIPNDLFPLNPDSINHSAMINKYKKLLFAGYVRSLSKGSFRSFEEIYNNTQCYKEDFVYSVDKYRGVQVEPKAQTIYIPAVDDTSLFNDTQIRYGEKYIYKCDAHYIIVGNKYHYRNLRFVNAGPPDPPYATVEVVNTPSVVVVPFSMFTETVIALMSPPIFPQAKFVTQNNSQNTIEIFLSPTMGEKIEPFIEILPSDTQQSLNMNLNTMSRSNKIRFKYSRGSGLYQIFKTQVPPKSYKDFQDKKVSDIRMPFDTNSAIFNDVVMPNKKYYYLFRKVNAKGLVSNPTPIYEVELLKDADDSKIVVTEYDFPEQKLEQDSRKFKSLFQIYPSQQQTWFDQGQQILYQKSSLQGTIDNLALGNANKSVWGRKFKIRVKSTTSGKIIDYNITFKLTKNKTEEDF